MEPFVRQELNLLMPITKCWQPSDFLPNLSSREIASKEIARIQEDTSNVSDELLVVISGHALTEEALPSYQTWLNLLEGITDKKGTSENPWAQWSKSWTAEENRHGDVLKKYLYLTGRVNMRAFELTIQFLIRNGFDPGTKNDPYKGFIYTSFQERATKICHKNASKLAIKYGDALLTKICQFLASDEARHETAYTRFAGKIFELDPEGALLAFSEMMKKTIVMPAKRMYDGGDTNLFDHFSSVAQRTGVYTTYDYAEIIRHLINTWNVANLRGLSSAATEAQEYLCKLPQRCLRVATMIQERLCDQPRVRFSWIYNREV